jgi:hypothetical protein
MLPHFAAQAILFDRRCLREALGDDGGKAGRLQPTSAGWPKSQAHIALKPKLRVITPTAASRRVVHDGVMRCQPRSVRSVSHYRTHAGIARVLGQTLGPPTLPLT